MVLFKTPHLQKKQVPVGTPENMTSSSKRLEITGYRQTISGVTTAEKTLDFQLHCIDNYTLPRKIFIKIEDTGGLIIECSTYTVQTVDTHEPWKNTFRTCKIPLTFSQHRRIFGITNVKVTFFCDEDTLPAVF